MLPSTVEGGFRASAVDGGPVREADPNKHGLKRAAVARAAVAGIDAGAKNVYVHGWVYELESGRLRDLGVSAGPEGLVGDKFVKGLGLTNGVGKTQQQPVGVAV